MAAGTKGAGAPAGSDRPDNPELPDGGLGVHIGFSTTGGWLSRIIRAVLSARVSHCFVVYHSPVFGKDMVLEASGQGFRVLAWRRFDRENKLIAIYRLRVPEPALAEAMEKLADRLGDAYDTLSLFGYLLRKWFKLKRTPFDSREKLICSEAVALFLAWGGVPVDEQKVVTPQDLLELVQSRPDLFELVDRGSGFDRVIEKAQRARRKKERRRQRSAVSTTSPAG